jgi:hypothetical protein
MKAIVVAMVLLGFIAGCARMQSSQSSSPSASPNDRPDLMYKTQAECEKAGHKWSSAAVCV